VEERVTETYTVNSSNRDYYNDQLGVFNESWTATKTYSLCNGKRRTLGDTTTRVLKRQQWDPV
jgi:hypothetical protein